MDADVYRSVRFSMTALTSALMLVFSSSQSLALQWPGLKQELERVQVGIESRLRYEWWRGLEPTEASEDTYDFYHIRVRPYLSYVGTQYSLFIQAQYASAFDLPENAVSGPGYVYYSLSAPHDHPDAIDLVDVYLRAKDFLVEGFGFTLGRQGIRDGEEVLYDDADFD